MGKKKKKKNLHLYSPLLELGVENAIGNKLALLRDRGGHSAFGEKQEEKGEDGDGNDFFFSRGVAGQNHKDHALASTLAPGGGNGSLPSFVLNLSPTRSFSTTRSNGTRR